MGLHADASQSGWRRVRTTLNGAGWAAGLAAGASVNVGFNATQGISLGDNGNLTGPGLFSTSAAQVAGTSINPSYHTGNGSDNLLKTGTGVDLLTGLSGADVFQVSSLSTSLLASPDRITDFAIGTDGLDGPYALASSQVANLGAVTSLTEAVLAAQRTAATFMAEQAATITFGVGPTARTFFAFNDGMAGFQGASDAVLEVTGYSGDLRNLAVI